MTRREEKIDFFKLTQKGIINNGKIKIYSVENKIDIYNEISRIIADRIALLGGFDMDKLCRINKNKVISHTKFLIE